MKSVRPYLPSAQFVLLIGALLLAGGLVYAAQRFTAPPPSTSITTTEGTPVDTSNWQTALNTIQAQNASTSIPQPPDQNAVAQALSEVQSANLTDSVGRTLFVDLTNAKSQGLGNDTPTQQQIVADAASQIQKTPSTTYTTSDLTVVSNSNASLRAYGNSAISVLVKHPSANADAVLLAVGNAVDKNDQSQLQALPTIAKEYQKLAQDLVAIPVPESLAPLDLLIINDFEAMSGNIPGMEVLLSDPLQGITATQQFNSLLNEEGRVFTNIALQLQKDGIPFNKNEPGSAWSVFLTPTV